MFVNSTTKSWALVPWWKTILPPYLYSLCIRDVVMENGFYSTHSQSGTSYRFAFTPEIPVRSPFIGGRVSVNNTKDVISIRENLSGS